LDKSFACTSEHCGIEEVLVCDSKGIQFGWNGQHSVIIRKPFDHFFFSFFDPNPFIDPLTAGTIPVVTRSRVKDNPVAIGAFFSSKSQFTGFTFGDTGEGTYLFISQRNRRIIQERIHRTSSNFPNWILILAVVFNPHKLCKRAFIV
jgi:hypothetical protein